MTVNQDYRRALQHLRRARQLMVSVMQLSDDWVAVEGIKTQFTDLRGDIQDFARCQLGSYGLEMREH